MARENGVRGRTVFLAVLVALLVGAMLVFWLVVKVAARILVVLLLGGLCLIGLLYLGLRRMFRD